MVLDDAVVHHRQVVTGKVRVGVALARRAVGSPAGVGDAQTPGQFCRPLGAFQLGDLARAAQPLQLAGGIQHGDPGAVVTTVFEALEPLEQNRTDITLGDGANDATHVQISWLSSMAAQISLTPRA